MKHYLVRVTRIDPIYDLKFTELKTKLSNSIYWDIKYLSEKLLETESTIEQISQSDYWHAKENNAKEHVMRPTCGDVNIEKDQYSAIALLNEQILIYGMEPTYDEITGRRKGIICTKKTFQTSSLLDKFSKGPVTVMMKYYKKHARFSNYVGNPDSVPEKVVTFKIELLDTLYDLSVSELDKYMRQHYTIPKESVVREMWERVKQERKEDSIHHEESNRKDVTKVSHASTFICNCWVVIHKRNKININYDTLFSEDIKAIVRKKKDADELCEKLHKIDGSDYVVYELKL